jgi:4-aminobutyrate aminotransferase
MVATEFTTAQGQPDGAAARQITQSCFEQGLLLLTCGSYSQVVRWIPPLIASSAQVDEALRIFERALAQVDAQTQPLAV